MLRLCLIVIFRNVFVDNVAVFELSIFFLNLILHW